MAIGFLSTCRGEASSLSGPLCPRWGQCTRRQHRGTQSSSTAFTNAGFSTVKVWLNSTSASGSPDLTLNRTDASFYNFGSGPYTGQWTWSNTLAYSTYFGNSLSNGTHYVEIN